jgi:hypothetical protein
MITSPIVFVLGAGASCPYDLPSGRGLRHMLCSLMQPGYSATEMLLKCGFHPKTIEEFATAFLRSGRTSIDAFLAHRPNFHDIGVAAIANALLPMERHDALVATGHQLGNGDWYQYLWSRMLEGVQSPEDVKANKIKFITFNYDRSLEQFLLMAAEASFGISAREALSLLPPIHHVYGSLGEYNEETIFRYGQTEKSDISRAASLIKTVPSSRPDIDTKAAEWLQEANSIHFIGFGFDEMNCRRLGVHKMVTERAAKHTGTELAGTCLDMTEGEVRLAKKHLGCTSTISSLNLVAVNALAYIRSIANVLN